MENGGMDNSSPFSDHKCINSNITITGDGGGPTPTDYNLPWFDPCIGPKRKVLPPPYPEQTTPIPSAKVMVNLPFHPSESAPPLVFTVQFEWDVMSPEEASPDAFAAEICQKFGFDLHFAAELSASIQIQLDDHVESCLRAVAKNSQRPTTSSKKTATSNNAAAPPDPTNRRQKPQRNTLEERKTPITDTEREKTMTLIRNMAHLDEEQFNFVKKLVDVFEPYSTTATMCKSKKSTCHVCHYVRKMCCAMISFIKNTMSCCPKRLEGHSYCQLHMQSRFNLDSDIVKMDPEYFAACPACTLYCPCSACQRKLQKRIVTDDYSIKGPSHAYVASSGTPKRNKRKTGKFAFMSASDSESDRGYRSRVKRRTQRGREGGLSIARSPRKAIAPPSLDNFTTNSCQVSPASRRRSVRRPRKKDDSEANGSNDDTEDGNFSICSSCGMQGEMICCDICPRAYHLDCLHISVKELPKGDWSCPICVSGEDTVVPYVENPDEEATPLSLLSYIISWQSQHELGKTFTMPVMHDSFASPQEYKMYKCVISDPRDLATITESLQSGCYDNDPSRGICDVKLVWHNCKVFNKDRSVLYRQADVMSQCFEQFYRDHIQHLLPVSSVRKLAEFEQKLSRNRPKLQQKLSRNRPKLQQMLSSLMSSSSFSKATQRSPRGSIDKKVNGIAASIKREKKSIMGEDITPQSLLFNG